MTELGIVIIAAISIAAIVAALRQPGGCLRYSFLCGALYLTWIVPQLSGLDSEITIPADGLLWLVIMVVLCLGASLIGWRIGTRQQRPAASLAPIRDRGDLAKLFWPVAALTTFMFALHVMINLQPLEARQQPQWSGPLTIIVFFLSLSVASLYLSLLITLRERSLRAFMLAGLNILLSGTSAFVAVRRGEMIDLGVAAIAALWFGAGKRVPIALVAVAVLGVGVVSYAIVPLRMAAKEIEARTGSSVGLLSREVWEKVDFSSAVESSARRAIDLSNAVYAIDYTNKWGEFTLGRESWNRLVFQWVPAQFLGADFKNALMFRQGLTAEQIQAEYGYATTGGTTSTGFGFAYQEFGLFGFFYFLLIGFLMGRLWTRAEVGDVWAQVLYVSFVGGALLSVTHHAMWLITQIPLFLITVFVLKRMVGSGARQRRSMGAYTVSRH
jgi:hypothetical protein